MQPKTSVSCILVGLALKYEQWHGYMGSKGLSFAGSTSTPCKQPLPLPLKAIEGSKEGVAGGANKGLVDGLHPSHYKMI